ncbi:MAG: glycosyltransferase family 4 protein [Candidatus Taylorbacteria bacterium]|nr:glycosyltransferase family 4 protein [Candidatus Taylorbacteria bacterium]
MNTPKRVLIFSLAYYPRLVGGAEVAVKEITDRIDPEDFEFHMLTMRTGKGSLTEERIGNVTVHRVGFSADSGILLRLNKYLFLVLAPLRASHLHCRRRFDAVWSIMAYVAGFPTLLFKLFHMDVPFVLTLQEGDPIDYMIQKTKPVQKLFRMIFSHADRIQAISRYLAEFARVMGAKSEPVVVPNGVDVEAFTKDVSDAEIDALRREFGVLEQETLMVTASRLVRKNGVWDIIRSLSYLPPETKLLVLGTGELESDLKEKTKELGLESRVIFKGFVPHRELPRYLKASDIFARPSLSEGFGNAFIEAMAAGIPVIATPVGGIVDFLRDKETGLFCEVGSSEDIARKALIYMNDRDLRDEIVDNALHMVVDHYDWKGVAKGMQDVLESAISSAAK